MNNQTDFNSCDCNYIKDTVIKIDKLQKDVVMADTTGRCIACETSLFTSANNTIPVNFLINCCLVTGTIGAGGATTAFFRIEAVRCNRYATVRLLEVTGTDAEQTVSGTNYTMVIDLNSVTAVQCFDPVNVELCNQQPTVNA